MEERREYETRQRQGMRSVMAVFAGCGAIQFGSSLSIRICGSEMAERRLRVGDETSADPHEKVIQCLTELPLIVIAPHAYHDTADTMVAIRARKGIF